MVVSGRTVVLNALVGALANLVQTLIPLILTPLILSYLSKEAYGIWQLVFSLVTAFGIVKLGLDSAVAREVPRLIVLKDQQQAGRVISTALTYYLLASVAVLAGTVVLLAGFPGWFRVSPEYAGLSRWAVGLAGACALFTLPLGVFRAVLYGLQRMYFVNLAETVAGIARIGLVVGVLAWGAGLIGLASVEGGLLLGVAVVVWRRAVHACPEVRVSVREARFSVFRSILGYSISSILYWTGCVLYLRAGLWVVGSCFGPEDAAPFSISVRLSQLVSGVVAMMMAVVHPASSALHAACEQDRLQKLLERSVKYAVLLSSAAAVVMLVLGGDFIRLWLRREDFMVAVAPLTVLAPAGVLYSSQYTTVLAIIGIGHHRMAGVVMLATTGAGVACSVALARWTSMGILAAAVGMSVPIVLTAGLVIPIHACRLFALSVWRHWWSSYLCPLLAVAPFAGALVAARYAVAPTSWWRFGAVLAAGAVVLAPSVWWLGLGRDERRVFVGLLRGAGCSKGEGPPKGTP